MSFGLAPSRSTVYVSNLPYSLTNNDLHKIFSKYGQVVKTTLVKCRETRKSKGVAFVQYLKRDDAQKCVGVLNGKEMFTRTLKCSIAKDNGRSAEFIKKKYYPDKSQCYECGEEGHLSYSCPKNSLGRRTPPPKKKKKPKLEFAEFSKDSDDNYKDSDEEEQEDEPDLETLSAAIKMEQERMKGNENAGYVAPKKKVIKKSSYFSDEEDLSE